MTSKRSFASRFIGDADFYKMVLAVAVPIMIQNGITNFVGLLDNIMIGRIGTEQMSGAAIVNQLFFIYNLCIFGGVAGAGIFTAQYFGQKNMEGIRHTFRFKLWIGVCLTILTTVLFITSGSFLISLYLKGEGSVADAAATLAYGKKYMYIMLFGLPAFMLSQIYSSTLRECGETIIPMKAGILSVAVNLVFNYILIYGKLGVPALGVSGAAIATVLSRYVETIVISVWTHCHTDRFPFITHIYRSLKVPVKLAKKIIVKGAPLLINEAMWAAGFAMLTQCYSMRSLNVVAALQISNTINNVFNVVFIAMGDAIAIIVGQLLGAGKMEKARDTDNKLIAFSVASCIVIAAAMFCLAPLFPMLYKTDEGTRLLAKYFIMATAVFMPQNAFMHACYFTLRSGGKTIVTFLFDSVFVWCVSVVLAATLVRLTPLPVIAVYILVQSADLIKCGIGYILVRKGVWIQNMVEE